MDQQRTMDFILEQQAKFFVGLEELRQQMTGLRQQVSQFAEQQSQINMSLGKAMLGLTEHVEKLISTQAHTDERLNALIGVVDGVVHRPPA